MAAVESDDCKRHIVKVGEQELYLLEGCDGSWICKFAYENRVEFEKARQYVDAVLDKIGEINMCRNVGDNATIKS